MEAGAPENQNALADLRPRRDGKAAGHFPALRIVGEADEVVFGVFGHQARNSEDFAVGRHYLGGGGTPEEPVTGDHLTALGDEEAAPAGAQAPAGVVGEHRNHAGFDLFRRLPLYPPVTGVGVGRGRNEEQEVPAVAED